MASAHTTRDPLWTGQFILLLVSAVLMYISTFMLTPTLPLFVEEFNLGSVSAGGVIVAAYTVGSLIPRLLWGQLADSRGRRLVYLLGVVIMALVSPFYAVLLLLPATIGLRLIQGVGFSAASTAGAAMSADLVPATRRVEGIGYYTLSNTLGMAIGPNLGIYILQHAGAPWLFGVSVLAATGSLLLGLFIRYERTRKHAAMRHREGTSPMLPPTPAVTPRTNGPRRWFELSVLPVCVVFVFVVIPYGAVMAYIAVYGLARGVQDIGFYFTVFAVALFAVRLVSGRISDRFGMTVVFVPGSVLSIGGLAVLWWAESTPVFMVSALLFGLGYGALLPLLQSSIYLFAAPERRGAASASLFATADIAYGLGAVGIGVGISWLGYPAAFALLAVFSAIALVLFLTMLRPRLRRVR